MCIQDSRRSYRTYAYATEFKTYSEVPVGTTEITERILVFRSTYLSYGTYTGLTELILVLRNLYWSYGTYTGLTELIFVYRTYSYLTDLILVL